MDYTLVDARFADGIEGEIDLKPELYEPVFEPLLDPAQFRKFSVHPEFHTLLWERGADIALEFLYEKAQQCRTPATRRP